MIHKSVYLIPGKVFCSKILFCQMLGCFWPKKIKFINQLKQMWQEVQSKELTFMMIKPDGVRRGLVGEVISRVERKGLKLRKMQLLMAPRDKIERHYAKHSHEEYYGELVSYMCSGQVVLLLWEGPHAIKMVRNVLAGLGRNRDAQPGTIRGDLAQQTMHFSFVGTRKKVVQNIAHASDCLEEAQYQVNLWFPHFAAENIRGGLGEGKQSRLQN